MPEARGARMGESPVPPRLSRGRWCVSAKTDQIRHYDAARRAAWRLLRAICGERAQQVGEPVGGTELLDEARHAITASAAARWTLDAQHIELADQVADRSIGGHF